MRLGSNALSLAALLWVIAGALVFTAQLDPDYWWHLRIGEYISATGIPREDILSWLAQGPWVAHEWAGEWLLYRLHGITGTAGSIVLLGSVHLGALALMSAIVRLLRPGTSALALAGVAVTAALVGLPVWLPRLQAFDLLFGLLALRIALGYFERGERRGLWVMPVIMIAWANLHGGGVGVYLLMMAGVIVGEAWNRRLGRGGTRPWRPLVASGAATVLAMAINPAGLAIYLYPLGTVASPAMQAFIAEWHSPNFHLTSLRPAQVFFAALVGLLAFTRVRDARAILLSAGFGFMFLQSGRYLGLFALTSLAVMAPWLLESAGTLWRRTMGRPFVWRELGASTLLSAVALLLAGGFIVGRIATLPAEQEAGLQASQPVVAATWLETRPAARTFNDYDWGGYLAWRLRVDVGAYGAADAFGEDGLKKVAQVLTLQDDPRAAFDTWQVERVVTTSRGLLRDWLDAEPGWRLVYEDPQAVVFERSLDAH